MFIDFLDMLPRPLRYVVFYGLFTIGIFTKPAYTLGMLAILLVAALISPKHWLTPWGQEPVERKRVLKIYGTALAFFCLFAYGLTPASPAASQVTSTSAITAASTSQEKNAVTSQKAPPTPRYDTIGTASNVAFQIIGMKAQQSLGSRQTQNIFIIPIVSVTNNQKDAISLGFSLFTLVDEKGREFSPLSSMDAFMMEENNQWTDSLNPGLTVQMAIPFEAPRDVNSLTLRCQGGMTGDKVTLRLDPPQTAKAPKRSVVKGLPAKVINNTNVFRVMSPGANPIFSLKVGDVVTIQDEDTRGMFYFVKYKNEEGYVKRSDLRIYAD